MFFNRQKVMALLIGFLLLFSVAPTVIAESNGPALTFQNQYTVNGQKLYVSVAPSLYDYYGNMSHTVNNGSDYANFVTPQAVAPIAECIQNITGDLPHGNEQFADAVLTMVHQISYVVSNAQYPVETLVDNSGDCIPLSVLAASIMQAGGLDVVLIDYTGVTPEHMNVGVYLPDTPVYHTAGLMPTDFVYDNKTYWTAEATNAADWKVGDQSASLAGAKTVIIPLDNITQYSSGQVSASLNAPLLSSSITINPSQDQSNSNVYVEQSPVLQDAPRSLLISGSISPAYAEQNVSLYVTGESSYDYFSTVTNDSGGYQIAWNFTSDGTYYIVASWSGTSNYAGADSQTLTAFAGPDSFIQFSSPEYNFVFGQPSFASYQLLVIQGISDFDSIPLGDSASFSYDFIVLQAGQTVTNVPVETVTEPGSTQTSRVGRNSPQTVQVPSETYTVPVNVPTNVTLLELPNDFNQTINNQFCFILQNNNESYSLNVNALDDYELSTDKASISNTAFMNASENVEQNLWYHVTESISGGEITADLYNTNGTLLENMVTPNNSNCANETIMQIANDVDSTVILKDLTVQALNPAIQPQTSGEKTPSESSTLIPVIALAVFLIAASSVTLIYVRMRRLKINKAVKN
jgi:hypothetical protein